MTFSDHHEVRFRKFVLLDFPAVGSCVCLLRRRCVAASFGRVHREGSEEEEFDNAGYVDFNFGEIRILRFVTCRPRTAGSVPVGRGPEAPVKGDRSTAASLRDLYPLELRSIAA